MRTIPRCFSAALSLLFAAGLGACTARTTDTPANASEGPTKRSAAKLAVAPQNTFARAVCVCGDLQQAGALHTEAEPGQSADVGVIGEVSLATTTHIQGAFLTRKGLAFSGEVSIDHDLVAQQDIRGAGELHVKHDVSCGGTMTTAGVLTVGGKLGVAGEQSHSGEPQVAATDAYAPPSAAPCGCDAFDVAGAVALARTSNDNASHQIDSNLASTGDETILLEAGRYYFEDAVAVGRAHFAINGSVSMYVNGSLDLVGQSQFEIADGGNLDLYVAGSVGYAGSIVAGNAKDPSAFRLYIGGDGAVMAGAGEATYSGFIFAPTATIAFAGTTAVHGALFAKHLEYAGDLRVKYAPPAARLDAPISTKMPEPYLR